MLASEKQRKSGLLKEVMLQQVSPILL